MIREGVEKQTRSKQGIAVTAGQGVPKQGYSNSVTAGQDRPKASKGIAVTARQVETQSKGIAIVLQQDRTDPKQARV